MTTFHNDVLDASLAVLSGAPTNALHACSAEPATYAAATTTNSLGSKAGVTFTAAADEASSPLGRSLSINTFTDGTVTADGNATHWALVDTTNSKLLATIPIPGAPITLVNGSDLKLTSALKFIAGDPTVV